jgi:DNA-directed RNA polymerase subunit RPC12/RpoP
MGFFSRFSFLTKRDTTQTVRPTVSTPMMSTDTGAKLPIFPFPMAMIVELAKTVDAVRIPIDTLNREMFKNGFEIIERYKYKCDDCGKDFEYPPKGKDKPDKEGSKEETEVGKLSNNSVQEMQEDSMVCDTCGSNNIVKPEPKNRKRLEQLMTRPVNNNEQTLEEVSRQLEQDLEIFDMSFLLTSPTYDINDKTGESKIKEYTEYVRIDPPSIAFIVDADGRLGYNDTGSRVMICPDPAHRKENIMYTPEGTDALCHICGAKGIPAWFEVNTVYGLGVPTPKRVVYAKGEIIWKVGKYSPGMLYGYSPIYTIWSKAMSLSHMDEYIRKYFDKMRPPRGMLILASRNYETFKKSWDAVQQKALEDPYAIQPLLVESDKSSPSGKMAQWLDFTGSLKELEFTEIRRELRMIIGALYGVLPLYFGELPTGWSQEGLQVTITNRAVKWGQDTLYKAFFRKISEQLGIMDWDIKLREGEETDKLRDLQIQGVEIENMKAYQGLGFEITRDAVGEFVVSKDPVVTLREQFEQEENNNSDNNDRVNPGERGRSSAAPKEEAQRMQGQPKKQRPGTEGGRQGDPRGAGRGTSGIRKNFPVGITPANFEIVKTTLQTALDFGWKKTKTVDELRKAANMTVRDARELVKNEFEAFERWESDIE